MKTENGALAPKSLAEVVRQVDNQKDFHEFILSHEGNPGAVSGPEVKYERHPTLGGAAATAAAVPPSQTRTQAKRQSTLPQTLTQHNIASPASQPPSSSTDRFQPLPYPTHAEPLSAPPSQPPYPVSNPAAQEPAPDPVQAAEMAKLQKKNRPTAPLMQGPPPMDPAALMASLPPVKPVFGVSLNDLYTRDGTAVPFIVYQCFQAVELFGLETEGIYRLSGSANHINHMKAVFDNGQSNLRDFILSDLYANRSFI